jgi:hypothetical protein
VDKQVFEPKSSHDKAARAHLLALYPSMKAWDAGDVIDPALDGQTVMFDGRECVVLLSGEHRDLNDGRSYLLGGGVVVRGFGGASKAIRVRGNASVSDVGDNASVSDVGDNASVSNVRGNASVSGVGGNASVSNVRGNASVSNVGGNASVSDVGGNASVSGVGGNASVSDVGDNASVSNVWGNASVSNVWGNAFDGPLAEREAFDRRMEAALERSQK